MDWSAWTALLLVGVVVLLVLYDMIAYTWGGNRATISRVCLEVSARKRGFALLLVFAMGVLVGHLFLPQRP